MMKHIVLLALTITLGCSLLAQDRVWLLLTDKGPDEAVLVQNPEQVLSPVIIAKRQAKGLSIDASDLPMHGEYLSQIRQQGVNILGTSRWLNAVAVEGSPEQLASLKELCFVQKTRPVRTLKAAKYTSGDTGPNPARIPMAGEEDLPMKYGDATLQNTMLNIQALHAQGFTGKGVRIALFDDGFEAVDTLDVFKHLWDENRVAAMYDFVGNDDDVFSGGHHGTEVMSTIGANLPGEMIGMAPDATFILCRTENGRSETRQEEYNWLAAVEWADSVGVDIIHTSLGYSEFDGGVGDYTYEDLDGNTTIITRAADMAASKGIIVTTSAGNEGNGSWHYISAPCDGDSVLCIGAINKRLRRSSFSSWGPSSDGQVKPDVVALGSRTAVASRRNYISSSDGTSFSGPLMGGFVACLRQAHPKRDHMDIIKAVQMSGDQYNAPDDGFGYGIPDAGFADSLLSNFKKLDKARITGRTGASRNVAIKKPAKKQVIFTSNPQSSVSVEKKKIIVSTDENISTFKLMRGDQEVILNGKNIKSSEKSVEIKKKYLIPGDDYYLHIQTGTYTENIKINLSS
ncbi:MAG: S8 family serine peptidase [Bacteroidia bacterium]